MKKIIYLFAFIGLVFTTACNPMDDINAEVDAQLNPIVGDATYTLTDDDYSDLGLTYGSFSSEDDAKTMLPSFLSSLYPVWGKGSGVLVGYKLYVGSAPGVSDYTYADDYRLANTDYPGAADNATGFYPDENPADYLPDILASNVSGASDGDNILVKYKQYVGEITTGISNFFETDFTDGTLGSFETFNELGDQEWAGSTYGAKMSGYSGGSNANIDWLISPSIDLTSQVNLTFQVSQIMNYSTELDLVNILVSTDFVTGTDPTTATWDVIDLSTVPPGTNWTPVLSEEYDFSAYEGEIIHIAFKYESTDSESSTWEIENVVIKTPGVSGTIINREVFYTLNSGSWDASEGVYFVSDADFDSMGEAYGQPGYYNNFGSTVPPDDYLPKFLSIKYPYALEEDEIFVIYDYYSSSSGAQIRGNLYTVIDGEWTAFQSTISTTLQFGHDGTKWVPDNTIKYTLTGADYAWIAAEYADKYAGNVATLINYQDFDYNWTDEMILDVLNGLLKHNFPGMAEGQKFAVTYLKYDGGAQFLTMYVILQGGDYVLQ